MVFLLQEKIAVVGAWGSSIDHDKPARNPVD